MNKAKELREKFEFELSTLQETCPHIEDEWMPYMFAPGHYSSEHVKVCKECDKILEYKPNSPDYTLTMSV